MSGNTWEPTYELRSKKKRGRGGANSDDIVISVLKRWKALSADDRKRVTKLELPVYPHAALDLTGCSALRELQLSGVNVKTVNLTGCTAMHTLSITDCPNLNTASLDLTTCGAVLDSLSLSRCRVTSIGAHGGDTGTLDLSQCSRLRELVLSGTKLVTLGANPFKGCGQLNYINASNCTSLGDLGLHGFQDCSVLHTVNLSGCSALRGLGPYGFEGCKRLAQVDLSGCAALRGIGAYAFEDCPLEAVSLSGCSSIGSIGTRAFSDSAITAIDLSTCTALTSIDDDAFYDCGALVQVTFPLSLVYIGKDAFAGCDALCS